MSLCKRVKMVWLLAAVCGAATLQATTWTNMQGGAWNDVENWDAGAPNGTSAYLTNTAAPYRVTLDAAPAGVVSNLYVSNAGANTTRLDVAFAGFTVSNGYIEIGRGGAVCVTNNGGWGYAGYTPASDQIAVVKNGGLLSIVDGGTVAFTNLRRTASNRASKMLVGDRSVGRMVVTNGTFAMNGWLTPGEPNTAVQLYVGSGQSCSGYLAVSGTGSVDLAGGSGATLYIGGGAGADNYSYGLLEVSGKGRVDLGNESQSALYLGSTWGTGVIDLKDEAELVMRGANRTVYLASSQSGSYRETGRITVAGHAKFLMQVKNGNAPFYMGGTAGSKGEITISDDGLMAFDGNEIFKMGSDNTSGRSVLTIKDRGYFACAGLDMCMAFNAKDGYAELNLEGGTLAITNGFYPQGLKVGVIITANTLLFSKACVNMSGGFINLMRNGTFWGHSDTYPEGILIAMNRNNSVGGAQGDFNMSGGTVTNWGALTLGLGLNTTGTLYQTGGLFVQGKTQQHPTRITVIGWGGGIGNYRVSGGTTLVYDPVYLGGVTTNQVPSINSTSQVLPMGNGSKGLLRVDSGSFTVTNQTLYCGSKGEGTIIIGSNGVCEAYNIVLTNNTQSVVRFELGKQGCGVLRAQNTLKIYEGAQLKVDAQAYTGDEPRIKLIDYATRVGEFATEDIVVIGHGKVVQNATGIWLYRPKGTLFQIR